MTDLDSRITKLEDVFSNQVLVLTDEVKELKDKLAKSEYENDRMLDIIFNFNNSIKQYGIKKKTKFNFSDYESVSTSNDPQEYLSLLLNNHIIYREDEDIEIIIYHEHSPMYGARFTEEMSNFSGYTQRGVRDTLSILEQFVKQGHKIRTYKDEKDLLKNLREHLKKRSRS